MRTASQLSANPSPASNWKRAGKHHFSFERREEKILPTVPQTRSERLIAGPRVPAKPRNSRPFLGVSWKLPILVDRLVEGAVCCEPVSPPNSLITGKIQGISPILPCSADPKIWF